MPSNPFVPIGKDAPKHTETNYNKDSDKYIITYAEVESVKILSDKESIDPKNEIENDFIINKNVKEIDRVELFRWYLRYQHHQLVNPNILDDWLYQFP